MTPRRIQLGQLQIDPLTLGGALDRIEDLVRRRQGGSVFTPNVDHVVRCEGDSEFRGAYQRADLALADGTPILWASAWLEHPLPERIAGSDLVLPLMNRAAARGWGVYLLGGEAHVAERAAQRLRLLGVKVVGTDASRISLSGSDDSAAVLERIAERAPEVILVGLGSPKQELWIDRHRARLGCSVALAVGASIDFLAGRLPRAPRWMSRAGLEWAFRLAHEPRRLWRRYLVDDPHFVELLARSWWQQRSTTRRDEAWLGREPGQKVRPEHSAHRVPQGDGDGRVRA